MENPPLFDAICWLPLRHRVFIEEAWAAMENAALPLGDPGGVSVELRSGCQKMWRKLAMLQQKIHQNIWLFPKNRGMYPQISHPKMVILSRKNPIVVGETHHFRKSPYVKVWMRTGLALWRTQELFHMGLGDVVQFSMEESGTFRIQNQHLFCGM